MQAVEPVKKQRIRQSRVTREIALLCGDLVDVDDSVYYTKKLKKIIWDLDRQP
jgi:hypothetical protein